MYKSANAKSVREINRQYILSLVKLSPDITAREISNKTGLQISTVLYTLKSLEDEKYIKNLGMGDTTIKGGKPPVIWGINPDFGKVLGLEILPGQIRIVICDFSGAIIYKEIITIQHSTSHIVLIHQIVNAIDEILKKSKIKIGELYGIGLSFPGIIDYDNGSVIYSNEFEFHSIRLKHLLEKQIKAPVIIDNPVFAIAAGLKWTSKTLRKTDNMVILNVNDQTTLIYVGMLLNGKIYRGANFSAGKLSNILSRDSLLRIVNNSINRDPKNGVMKKLRADMNKFSFTELVKQSDDGNQSAVYVLKQIGKELSTGMSSIPGLLDPETILICGDICKTEKYLKSILRDRLVNKKTNDYANNIEICFSEYGGLSGAVGAAGLVFDKVFSITNN
ncbi:MAG: ROK family transcriptional regulator [Melioribacteraceae bacterium]|nr:ROK family transcriptional regulator [Melioribacteraceae bacterium]